MRHDAQLSRSRFRVVPFSATGTATCCRPKTTTSPMTTTTKRSCWRRCACAAASTLATCHVTATAHRRHRHCACRPFSGHCERRGHCQWYPGEVATEKSAGAEATEKNAAGASGKNGGEEARESVGEQESEKRAGGQVSASGSPGTSTVESRNGSAVGPGRFVLLCRRHRGHDGRRCRCGCFGPGFAPGSPGPGRGSRAHCARCHHPDGPGWTPFPLCLLLLLSGGRGLPGALRHPHGHRGRFRRLSRW